ncbi:MAG: hypothetical protein ABR599_12540 [Gemmatimonadota bacterium]
MSEPLSPEAPRRRASTSTAFSFGALVRVLAIPLVTAALFLFLFDQPEGPDVPAGAEDMAMVGLVQKDAKFRPIPPDRGGATGTVWYTPAGETLELQLRAEGLDPQRQYLLEIGVDGTIYTIGSYRASGDGEMTLDTTLTRFAEGVCVGPNYDAPRPLAGPHEIRFWVKRDGNPPSGTGRDHAPEFSAGADLPCSGNGDGDYTYVLLENEVARFTGGVEPADSVGADRPLSWDRAPPLPVLIPFPAAIRRVSRPLPAARPSGAA